MFQFGGAWSFVWGAKLSKDPRGDGTGSLTLLGPKLWSSIPNSIKYSATFAFKKAI